MHNAPWGLSSTLRVDLPSCYFQECIAGIAKAHPATHSCKQQLDRSRLIPFALHTHMHRMRCFVVLVCCLRAG